MSERASGLPLHGDLPAGWEQVLPEFTSETLASVIPTRDTRVLIYCNNNFRGAEGPFPTKRAVASEGTSTRAASSATIRADRSW